MDYYNHVSPSGFKCIKHHHAGLNLFIQKLLQEDE